VRVRAVPALVCLDVPEPEIRRQVHDAHSPLTQRGDDRRRRRMGVGDDCRIHVCVTVEIQLFQHQRHAVARVHLVQPLPRVGAGGDRLQIELGVAPQDVGG
jgi:hypothetical protein